ncbi:MAG: InlB B-repeat-containing protein [Treponema sp.]|nr:InlB B-repeat-containing protein [Treponema sp.]
MQHLKHAIRLLTALTVSIAALALSSCSDDFWTAKYTITYSTEHGIRPAAIELESGTVLTSAHLPTLTADGYTFDGWKDTTQQIKITEGYTIKSDLNLVAQWTEAGSSADTCTITYLSLKGTEPDTKTVEKNTKLTAADLPTLTDSDDEYDFAGWYNKSDSSKRIITPNSFKVTKDITLAAKWTKKSTSTTNEVANVAWASATAGDEKVTLNWTYPSYDFSTVQITVYRTGTSTLIGAKNVSYPTESVTIENLANGTEYCFKLVAKNKAGTAATTAVEVSATPEATSTTGGTGNTGSDDSGDKGGLIILVQ